MKKLIFSVLAVFSIIGGGCRKSVPKDVQEINGRFKWVLHEEVDGTEIFVLKDSADGRCHLIISSLYKYIRDPATIPDVPCTLEN